MPRNTQKEEQRTRTVNQTTLCLLRREASLMVAEQSVRLGPLFCDFRGYGDCSSHQSQQRKRPWLRERSFHHHSLALALAQDDRQGRRQPPAASRQSSVVSRQL
jgi:hypothetical protein